MSSHQITLLLKKWSDGDEEALAELTPLLYSELHRMALNRMRQERAEHTLQPTALINEAFLRLMNWKNVRWQNRAHFFAVSAQLMRRILVDFARTRKNGKHGHGVLVLPLEEARMASRNRASEVVDLDDALARLSAMDDRKSKIVELRFFGGLSVDETAEVLNVSSRTVLREWDLAKAWLSREMSREDLQ